MLSEELTDLVKRICKQKYDEQTIEVKAAQGGCPRLYDTLSSFSNQNTGGVIVFGLDEKQGFAPVGVYDVQDLQHRASEQCKQMEPVVRPLFSSCEIDGKRFVGMEIPAVEAAERPVYYKGAGKWQGSYVRVGDADERMTDYEIYSFEAYRKQIREDIRETPADMESLDKNLVESYLRGVRMNRANTANLSDTELLSLMGLTHGGRPTLAAVLCFSKYPQAQFPQLCLTAVLIPGTRMGDTSEDGQRFLDNRRIEGTIPQIAEGAVNFVAMNMRAGVRIENGKRTDVTEYPLTAVREAIINALVHRDYSPYTEGMPVRLEMYRDRLEIVNAGGLYGAIDIDELGRIHADTRNKTLVSVLETMKVVENRYSGIPTIRKQLAESGLPEPLFEDKRGLFRVVFYNAQTAGGTGKPGSLEEYCKVPRTRKEIAAFLGMTQAYAIRRYVEPLIGQGVLAYTVPERPHARNQKIVAAKHRKE